jgi:hypothetical protein
MFRHSGGKKKKKKKKKKIETKEKKTPPTNALFLASTVQGNGLPQQLACLNYEKRMLSVAVPVLLVVVSNGDYEVVCILIINRHPTAKRRMTL